MRNKKIKINENNRVSSPEELDAYIRTAHPGVWVGLAAIVALLIGVFVWSFVGRIEVQVNSYSHVKDGDPNIVTYIHSKQFNNVNVNQVIRLENGKEITLTSLDKDPVVVDVDDKNVPIEVRSKSGWNYGEIIYKATSDNTIAKINSGCYSSVIVTASITPMSFVFNF